MTGIPTVTDKVCLSERCLTVAGHRVRPFSENAHIHCRDYSQPLQRRLVDFASDSSFETASQKMKEHYGFIPVVLFDEETEGDKRKTRKVDWQEAKLCLAYGQGSRDKRHRVVMGKTEEKLPDSIPSEHF